MNISADSPMATSVNGKVVAKAWFFESNSHPGKFYETRLYTDGTTSCQCRGWTMAKGGRRVCTHTNMVANGLADGVAARMNTFEDVITAAKVEEQAPQKVRTEKAKVAQKRRISWK